MQITKMKKSFLSSTHSGISPGGMTILITSEISLYFMIRSEEVVDVRDGDALTCHDKK